MEQCILTHDVSIKRMFRLEPLLRQEGHRLLSQCDSKTDDDEDDDDDEVTGRALGNGGVSDEEDFEEELCTSDEEAETLKTVAELEREFPDLQLCPEEKYIGNEAKRERVKQLGGMASVREVYVRSYYKRLRYWNRFKAGEQFLTLQ